MNTELQNKLFKKYPKLFRQRELSMQETCMCWGIACGDGWYWLIDNLCNYISLMDKTVEATQVKEKFGTLRFYTNCGSDEIDAAISFAGLLSGKICEVCGSTDAKVRGKGWLMARCDTCLEKRGKD